MVLFLSEYFYYIDEKYIVSFLLVPVGSLPVCLWPIKSG